MSAYWRLDVLAVVTHAPPSLTNRIRPDNYIVQCLGVAVATAAFISLQSVNEHEHERPSLRVYVFVSIEFDQFH